MLSKHQWDHQKLRRLEKAHGLNLLKFLTVIILGGSLGILADKFS